MADEEESIADRLERRRLERLERHKRMLEDVQKDEKEKLDSAATTTTTSSSSSSETTSSSGGVDLEERARLRFEARQKARAERERLLSEIDTVKEKEEEKKRESEDEGRKKREQEQEEHERKEREDLERKEREEHERKEREDRERKEREEHERKEREDREKKEREERERKEREEHERKEREEHERKEREEHERKEREGHERKEREEREKRDREDRERKEREEHERKEREEHERKEREEHERKEREEHEKKEQESVPTAFVSSGNPELDDIERRRQEREKKRQQRMDDMKKAEQMRKEREDELARQMEADRLQRKKEREARYESALTSDTAKSGAADSADAKKRAEEEAAAKKRAEEETAAKKRAEEETAAKKRAEEESAAKKRAEEESAARRKAEEESAAKKRGEEEAAAKKRAEEESAAKKRAEEEAAAKKRAEEESAAKKRAEEESAKKRAEEEAAANKRVEEESAAKKRAEEDAAAKKRAEEEAAAKKRAEEDAAAKRRAEEDRSKKMEAELSEEEVARRRRDERREERRKRLEEAASAGTTAPTEPSPSRENLSKRPSRKEMAAVAEAVKIEVTAAEEGGDSEAAAMAMLNIPASGDRKLVHLTGSRPKPKRTSIATSNPARLFAQMESVDITETKIVEEPEAPVTPNKADKPKIPAGAFNLFGGGTPPSLSSKLSPPQESSSSDETPVVKKKPVLPPGGGGAGLLAAMSGGVKLKKSPVAIPSDAAPVDPSTLKAGLKPRKFKDASRKYFMQLKGKKKCWVRQVPQRASIMNHGDVFILDANNIIYVWNGSKATQAKKALGLEVAHRIRDKEYTGKVDVVQLEASMETSDSKNFWKLINGSPSEVKSAEDGGDDVEYEKHIDEILHIYGFDASGEKSLLASGRQDVSRRLLNSNLVCVLDAYYEVYIWTGKNASQEARDEADNFAQSLMKEKGRPADVILDYEDPPVEKTIFREKFCDWKENDGNPLEVKQQKNVQAKDWAWRVYDRGSSVSKVEKIDVLKMYEPEIIANGNEIFEIVHNGVGELKQIWYCQEKEKFELPVTEKHFFSAEGYVFLFQFMKKNVEGPGERPAYVMYYWLGKDCKNSDLGVSALLAVELDKKYGAPQIRVEQGKEPHDFVAIFNNRFYVHEGFRSSYDPSATALYHVRGSDKISVRLEHATLSAESLCSANSFVLCTKSTVYTWYGLGTFDFEEDAAGYFADSMANKRTIVEITEGEETADFWKALGGKKEYAKSPLWIKSKRPAVDSYRLRLFHTSYIRHGNPTAEEIENFCSRDLNRDGVYILDAYFEIFVWIGRKASESIKEVKLALETSLSYAELTEEVDGRCGRSSVTVIHQVFEPLRFKGLFQSWTPPLLTAGFLTVENDEEDVVPELRGSIDPNPCSAETLLKQFETAKYPPEKLKGADIPFGVDPASLEEYLEDAHFEKLFGCSRDEYQKLPKWKQTERKRTSGIF